MQEIKHVEGDYFIHRNGKVTKKGKEVKTHKDLVYINGKLQSLLQLFYREFIGSPPSSWLIRRINTKCGHSVDNLISYPKGKDISRVISFCKPLISRLNFFKSYFGIENQFTKLKEELLELTEAIDGGDILKILEEMADVFIISLQIILHAGVNRFINVFMFKMDRTDERIKKGFYQGGEK